jgi:glycosyltransferase involved in cell wall biosynthesis
VRSSPRHSARIAFAADANWDETNPWHAERAALVEPGFRPDVHVLGGKDWGRGKPDDLVDRARPVINLVQNVRHAREDHPHHSFLDRPAIRICLSPEISEAVAATGRARGPVLTIPAALDLDRLPAPRPAEARDLDCLVLAVKHPDLGAAVARRLSAARRGVRLVDRPVPRAELLDAMARARVTVLLPNPEEGVYLPALEAMALETIVVCPDAVGNRSYCRDGETCFVPGRSEDALAEAARAALAAAPGEVAAMLGAAASLAWSRTLQQERARFLAVLDGVDELWEAC